MNTHTTNLPAIEKHNFPNSHIISCLNLNLAQIAASGQCFRMLPVPEKPGIWSLISGTHYLEISGTPDGFFFDCPDEALPFWKQYFDLGTDYGSFIASIRADDAYLAAAADAGSGIRILRQDPWETLITFIISQRKSIPAIRSAVEALAKAAGKPVKTPYEIIYTFPTPKELSKLSLEELKSCSLGYRAPYIYDTVKAAVKTPGIMKKIGTLDDEDLLQALMDFPGVGIKVAGCTALFGYGRTSFAPVDVWISRVIDTFYQGENPFPSFGENAGILQQYLFFYAQTTKLK